MISVIICSVNEMLAGQVRKNIGETIGVPWQLILIDNSQLKKGICHVYNLGAAQAQYDILCFVHEDVLFQTNSWGAIIASYFKNDAQLGLVGIAGGRYKSKTLSGWWTGITAFDCCNVLYHDSAGTVQRVLVNPAPPQTLHPVKTIDGVFMCASKAAWAATRFDEASITGFHFYDISFSFAVAANYNVAVTLEIDVLHLKRWGDHDDVWLKYALNWHAANKQALPAAAAPCSIKDGASKEWLIYRNWLSRLRYDKINLSNRLRLVFNSPHWLHPGNWPHIMLFMVSGPAGNRRRRKRGK